MAVLCQIQGMRASATADIQDRSVYLACLDEFSLGLLWTTNIPGGNGGVGGIKASAPWTTSVVHSLLLLSNSFIGYGLHRAGKTGSTVLEPST
jgi:hypothetical protein